MDDLYQCYRSNMRLYVDRPDVLTPGRWEWAPPGALDLPFETIFCSSKYDPYDWLVNPPLGEVRGILGYSSGRISPRYTGRHFCGPAFLWQNGSPFELQGTPAVDPEGVPLCCAAPPAVGGLAMGGVGSWSDWTTALVWLRAEDLESYSDGDTLTSWPAAPFTSASGTGAGVPVPTVLYDSVSGLPGGLFNARMPTLADYGQLFWPSVSVNDWTCIAVGKPLVGGSHGPAIYGTARQNVLLSVGLVGVFARDFGAAYTLTGGAPPPLGELHVWCSTRSGSTWTLYQDGVVLATGTGPTDPLDAGGMQPSFDLSAAGQCWIPEVQILPFAFSAAAVAAVSADLLAKYGGADVIPPGVILDFAGTGAAPSGWLICDGHAVSRTDFAALFAAIGTTYGDGDGTSTFNLPDCRGRLRVASGTPAEADLIATNATPINSTWSVPSNVDRWANGQQVILSGTGTLPGGFSFGTTYTLGRVDATNIQLYDSPLDLEDANPKMYHSISGGQIVMTLQQATIAAGQLGGSESVLLTPDNVAGAAGLPPTYADCTSPAAIIPIGAGNYFGAVIAGNNQDTLILGSSGVSVLPFLTRPPYTGVGAAIIKT